MKSNLTRLVALEARAAARMPKPRPDDAAAAERLRRHFESLPMRCEREARAETCMTIEQALASVERETAYAEEQAKVADKAGQVDLARVFRLGPQLLRHKRRELEARLNETRRDHTAAAGDHPVRTRERGMA